MRTRVNWQELRAGDVVAFHDPRQHYGARSRQEATVLEVKQGCLDLHEFPLVRSATNQPVFL